MKKIVVTVMMVSVLLLSGFSKTEKETGTVTKLDNNTYEYENDYYTVSFSKEMTLNELTTKNVLFTYDSKNYVAISCFSTEEKTFEDFCNRYEMNDEKKPNYFSADNTFGEQMIPSKIFCYNDRDIYYQSTIMQIGDNVIIIDAQAYIADGESEEAYEQDEAFMNIYESINFKELTGRK